MSAIRCDIAIVGGGLSGGLIAAALARRHPHISLRLIEAGERLGGNHRWSWFASDLDEAGTQLMDLFPHMRWDDGYNVRFPAFERRLRTGYRSLFSGDFDRSLRAFLPAEAVLEGRTVIALDAGGVIFGNGDRVEADAVIDCRGASAPPHLTCGWQVFYGRHVRTSCPHGVQRPTIMDARVSQHGAYRFVYILPLTPDELFVEDTYYADEPALDLPEFKARVDRYCTRHDCEGDLLHEESGILPVITGGDFAAFQAEQLLEGVACAGARAGFTHPLTSYTLPLAVRTAVEIARCDDLSGPSLAALLEKRARGYWRATGFYRLLGAMLFAAAPEERYRIFERFYRLPESLVERFYAGDATGMDKARIVCGKPPLKLGEAFRALTGRRAA